MRCAKELILEHGVDKVSMVDIAKKAELSKATLYLYFPSKDLLFKEICDIAGIQFINYFRSRQRPGLSVVDTLKLIWDCYLDLFGESDDMLVIFSMKKYLAPDFPFVPIEKDSPSPAGSNYAFYSLLVDLFTKGVEEGVFAEDVRPASISRTFITFFSYVVETAAKLPKSGNDYRWAIEELANLFQIFLRGIARDGTDLSDLKLPESADEKNKR
ncbi:MAG: TetR/AcrR family transcriptional regulator; helix-turn-helix transcriptional regulator [Treponema sp.]|nr:TetR/AcrR family transcriptional regulator; helix-turn-helix transcriptional regulator [Treponema sp.]